MAARMAAAAGTQGGAQCEADAAASASAPAGVPVFVMLPLDSVSFQAHLHAMSKAPSKTHTVQMSVEITRSIVQMQTRLMYHGNWGTWCTVEDVQYPLVWWAL